MALDRDYRLSAPRKRLAVAGLVAASLVAGGCTRPTSDTTMTVPRVVVLGLDAGTWDLLDPYMSRGLLPNLARLRSGGTSSVLHSLKPSSSPVIWTTVATGKLPHKHGITFFVRFPEGNTGQPAPVTSTMRRGKAIWNILSDAHYDVAMVGWFVTWPVEAINGRMVSDRAHWGAVDERGVFPPGYLAGLNLPTTDDAAEAVPRFMTFDFDRDKRDRASKDPKEQLNFLVFDRFVKAFSRDLYYARIADRVLEDPPLPDLFMLYLRGTDDVQHGFWKFMDPEPFGDVPSEDVERFGKVIERYWQWVDQEVGQVLARYDLDETLVLVVSDHGAGPAVGEHRVTTPEYLHLSGSHRHDGILIAHGPGIRRGARVEAASVVDVTPTLLHYLGMPVAENMDGKVITELFEPALAAREIEWVASYDTTDYVETDHPRSEVDEKALEHLRSLGYIE